MKPSLCSAAALAWSCACVCASAAGAGVGSPGPYAHDQQHDQAPGPSAFDAAHNVTYAGIRRNDVEAFLGIRYGLDTGGRNRFRPPRAHAAQPGSVVDATAVGPGCPQDPSGAAGVTLPGMDNVSEDCLSLNVVRPNGTAAGDRLAVMAWIVGGGFWVGRAQDYYTAPDDLIAQSVGNGLPVIHVAMNYRLGVFGFAQNDALKAEGSENAGLRDQRLALEWIRDNIEHFGGDPQRVTIFGQSSGGLSVGLQIMAYGGREPLPFQQAICQSSAMENGITADFTINAMRDVVGHLGIPSDLHSADTVAALRAFDTGTLLNASMATYTTAVMDGDIWLPAVDGDFLPDAPSRLMQTRRLGRGVTTMIGWCQDDEDSLTSTSVRTANDTRRTVAAFVPHVSPANLDRLLALYPSDSPEFSPPTTGGDGEATGEGHGDGEGEAAALSAEFRRAARIKRDILMVCQPLHYARHLAAAGSRVYLYNWNQTFLDRVFAALGSPPGLGVVHLSDVPYVYSNARAFEVLGVRSPFTTDSDARLADRGSRTFSTFASVGRPGLPHRDTFQGFVPAFGARLHASASANSNSSASLDVDVDVDGDGDWNVNVFIAGGPAEGSSALDGPWAREEMRVQRLRERCGFINSPEMIEQLRY
ncbi:Lipase 4 [Escovopsis weberi]|uniref:Carboxylic ester hydrolase n=1 Tax=Escovopsis weberi TaxID=150374 RepID=A0A0M9VSP3_ESCWE|nr:Lipase 4 [Escovopsis weberi]